MGQGEGRKEVCPGNEEGEMTMRNAVLYARVSSREQEQEGYSIQAQQRLLRAYAEKQGFAIVREFVDVETAKATGRKAFGEMLTHLRRLKGEHIVLVEKTDRLYRNFEDQVTLEKLNPEIHFVKTGNILSKNAKAQTKFMHGIEMVSAKYYSDNLREEVMKGMLEKARQGIYPGRAPFGYRNNRATREIDVHPVHSEIVRDIFRLYAAGNMPLTVLRKTIREQYGKTLSRAYLHTILKNRVYVGLFVWGGVEYRGKHEPLISIELFDAVQAALQGHHRGKYGKVDIAFRGMLTCAHDGCSLTGERKKEQYVYYRCTGYRGKCALPRFREEQIAERMGAVLQDISIPEAIVAQIMETLQGEQARIQAAEAQQKQRLQKSLDDLRRRQDQAYTDKLDGRITEGFWQRKQQEWQREELELEAALATAQQPRMAQKLLDAQRILELAQRAHSLYLTRKPAEQADLLRKVLLNCSIDGASITPTYRKPFDMIFNRAKRKEWSGREDLNLRPPGPELWKEQL